MTGRASPRSPRWPRAAARPLVATGDVLYHAPHRRPLQDVLSCVREKTTIQRSRPQAGSQRRAPPQAAAGDGAPVPRPRGSAGAHAGDRRGVHVQSRRAGLRIPRRADAARQDPAGASGRARLGGRPLALPRRHPREGARADRARAAAHRHAPLRPVLPHRARHRPLRALQGHPLPGARLGRQLRRLLLPRHHRGEPHRDRRAVRPLRVARAQGAARHRRRLRARAARGGDPVHLRALRPRPRRPRRHRHLLSRALGGARRRQGHGAVGGYGRRARRHGVGHDQRRRIAGKARARGGARSRPIRCSPRCWSWRTS